jgi:hypothetical protein
VWKEAKSVCSELTVTLGVTLKRERDLYDCLGWCACRSTDGVRGGIMTVGVVEPSPSATPKSWSASGVARWRTGGQVSSTQTISSDSVVPDSTPTSSSSDPLGTRGDACLGIHSPSPSSAGVTGLLDGDSDGGTSSSMKFNAATSETADEPAPGAISVLFPTTTRQ